MKNIEMDITGVLSKTIGEQGIDEKDLYETAMRLDGFKKDVYRSPYPFMDFAVLKSHIPEIKDITESLKRFEIKNLVILGIGGSSLGTETIFHALLHPFHNLESIHQDKRPRYFILDNIDPNKINKVAEIIERDRKKTLLVVISKSGETPETMSQFMLFKDILKSTKNYRQRIIVITDSKKGMLREIVKKEGYPSLPVPEGIGGRFSVLTPVGLFPSSIMGIDIEDMVKGAEDMSSYIKKTPHKKNMAVILAAILYLMDRYGKKMHVMMPYCDRLSAFSDWFRQLEAESLGKAGSGPTPIKSIGVTDQHSQLQLYIDGPKDKCIIFLYHGGEKRQIPDSISYINDLEYLAGKDMGELFYAEFLGTRRSLIEAKTPNLTINVNEINEYSLGALFFLYEMVIAMMGHLYNINAFDQPGVELGKIYTKAVMGKKGLEKQKKTIEKDLTKKRYQIGF
ncbi:MAG: hypothetical protein N3D15_05330 [Syntrophorhabdaceae bacterium]|nr:hypothetical protein [Syntrophorhabdaceae bacterium]